MPTDETIKALLEASNTGIIAIMAASALGVILLLGYMTRTNAQSQRQGMALSDTLVRVVARLEEQSSDRNKEFSLFRAGQDTLIKEVASQTPILQRTDKYAEQNVQAYREMIDQFKLTTNDVSTAIAATASATTSQITQGIGDVLKAIEAVPGATLAGIAPLISTKFSEQSAAIIDALQDAQQSIELIRQGVNGLTDSSGQLATTQAALTDLVDRIKSIVGDPAADQQSSEALKEFVAHTPEIIDPAHAVQKSAPADFSPVPTLDIPKGEISHDPRTAMEKPV